MKMTKYRVYEVGKYGTIQIADTPGEAGQIIADLTEQIPTRGGFAHVPISDELAKLLREKMAQGLVGLAS
jgi:hypothetical protein